MSENTVRFDGVKCKAKTDKAILVVIEDEEYWIPLTQVDDDSEVYNAKDANYGTLIITEWIAQQKGLVP